MTKSILTSLALTASMSIAGTTMVAPTGKGTTPPKMEAPSPCPNYLTYNQVEVSYVHLDGAGAGTGNGANVRVNYGIGNNLYLVGDTTKLGGDVDNFNLDLGLGGFLPLNERFHLIGRAGYSYFDGGDSDSNGWFAAAGFRAQVTCNLELNAKFQYGDLVDFDNGDYTSIGAGAMYHINDAFAVLAEYVWGEDDAWSTRAGVAFKF
jgi:hypothetical protein